jgi:hypothetical protein
VDLWVIDPKRQINQIHTRYRANFAYINAELADVSNDNLDNSS